MKKFMILMCALFSFAVSAAESTVQLSIGSVATVTDVAENVWMEIEVSEDICGGKLITTPQTTNTDKKFFLLRTMLVQANATNMLTDLTVECSTGEVKKVMIR